jgi:hypothetical protein
MEEHRQRVLENRLLRKVAGEETYYIIMNIIIFTLRKM